MPDEGAPGAATTVRVRIGAIGRWSVTGVYLVTFALTIYLVIDPTDPIPREAFLLVPFGSSLALATIAMWRATLDLGTTELRRTRMMSSRTVEVRDIERVAMVRARTGGAVAQVYESGRTWPMRIDLRYWDRSELVHEYFRVLAARTRVADDERAPGPRHRDDVRPAP